MNNFVKPDTEPTVSFGPFTFHPQQRLVTCEGRSLALGGRALDILQVLVEHAGTYVDKQTLIARVWPDSVVEDINLRVHIAALRRAFRDGTGACRYIRNDPGQGYCFAPSPVSASRIERHNLPARLSPVLGRDRVLGQLLAEIPRHGLTTVTGPGGVGKTTVALGVAELLLGHLHDGVWFVDLDALTDPGQVRGCVARTLGLAPESLEWQLKPCRMLLVLDGCDRLLDGCRELVLKLRAVAPDVSVLVSSRECLDLADEHVVQLSGLAVTDDREVEQALLACPAVQLLVDRIGARLQGFRPNDRERRSLARIGQRLDGLPLALELAAAQVGVLGVAGVLEQLDDGLALLSHGRRTALARHRSLEASLDWSFERLGAAGQAVLLRLAVFEGPFTLEAALAVISCPELEAAQVVSLLSQLVKQSLVMRDRCGEEGRFFLLHTTRAYALEKLQRGGQWHHYHRRYVLQEAWAPHSRPMPPRHGFEQRIGLH
ncbi:transcriptional regulator [Pseudomonas sp. AF76]|uniref:ATP-binding protein n=1 Tax=unclassified Pseudomonas TaxID=196821 RepID=UPI000F48BDA7|nr:winged helix-turn-helix domain-containing protein [Pseudomonas sp. AF76]ROO36540.1 transcriptional regulator [Pseudomonas sp. AF76]